MAYSTEEDIRRILVGARNVNENINPNSLDADQIEDAISSADTQIDAALRNKYAVPVKINGIIPAEVPSFLHSLSMDIASYLAFLTYRQDREFVSTLASPLLRYQRAMDLLQGIVNGTVELDLDISGTGLAGDAGSVFNMYDGPLFPSSNIFNAPEGYIPPDWVFR